MDIASLLDELPAERRLALAYAPTAFRANNLVVILLDLRLSRLVAQRREPLLTQMRLAWWRDRLNEEPTGFHHDEPLLDLLKGWGPTRARLTALVDGWEALLVDPPITDGAIDLFAKGRGQAFAALAERCGVQGFADEARRAASNWALADLAARSADPTEAAQVQRTAAAADWKTPKLPRALRPLAVLHGLAARKQGKGPLVANISDGFAAMRLGILGR